MIFYKKQASGKRIGQERSIRHNPNSDNICWRRQGLWIYYMRKISPFSAIAGGATDTTVVQDADTNNFCLLYTSDAADE